MDSATDVPVTMYCVSRIELLTQIIAVGYKARILAGARGTDLRPHAWHPSPPRTQRT